jgi:demethylmenaquinone methyltransferase/2-methoxy-6-polyprenyl-1,4-benzoquinol methylase
VTAGHAGLDDLLAEQIAYYRARAPEYLSGALDLGGGEELDMSLDRFRPDGDVLELACGPGTWTPRLLSGADSLTCVDSSPEMIALASESVGHDPRVDFVRADLFTWLPNRRYDSVFFGFWLSHVPLERFESFWSLVDDALKPAGRVLFVDDGYRTPEELIEGEESSTIERRLEDGTAFRAVKVVHEPAELEARLRTLGWDIRVHATAGPFYWGAGQRAA